MSGPVTGQSCSTLIQPYVPKSTDLQGTSPLLYAPLYGVSLISDVGAVRGNIRRSTRGNRYITAGAPSRSIKYSDRSTVYYGLWTQTPADKLQASVGVTGWIQGLKPATNGEYLRMKLFRSIWALFLPFFMIGCATYATGTEFVAPRLHSDETATLYIYNSDEAVIRTPITVESVCLKNHWRMNKWGRIHISTLVFPGLSRVVVRKCIQPIFLIKGKQSWNQY